MTNSNLYSVWNQVPVDYYQEGVKGNFLQKFWHGQKLHVIKQIIRKFKFENCLDIGCASGYMTSKIANDFPKVKFTGVDIYDKAIDFAKKKYPNIKFYIAPAEKLPFSKEVFDLVINVETIEHVEDPRKALSEIRRVLKKEGIGIVTMDSGSWLFRLVWFLWEHTKGKVWKGAHLHPFTHRELGKLISKSGFTIKQKIFSNFGMEVTFVLSK